MDGRQDEAWAGHGAAVAEGEGLVWRPSGEAATHVYEGFELRLADLRGDRMRLIRPADGFASREENGRTAPGSFLHDARLGGLAVLIARGLGPEGRQVHDTARLYADRLLASRATLRRRFTGPLDFKVGKATRRSTGWQDTVPAAAEGRPLTLTGLFALGDAEAARRGEADPSRDRTVHLGLYAAARLDPLSPDRLSTDEARTLVRSALFDTGLAPSDVADGELEIVAERFADAVDSHLDDGLDTFGRWFDGPTNSLVRQLAKKRLARGGELDPARVTAALAELGWRGLLLGAECVEAQMRAVAADLPDPLSADDRDRLEAVYFRRPWLGGLSVCLLAERFEFLREAVWDVAVAPADPTAVGTLLRLLQYYAAAASLRRETDRDRKRRSKERRPSSGTAGQGTERRGPRTGRRPK